MSVPSCVGRHCVRDREIAEEQLRKAEPSLLDLGQGIGDS